MSYSISLFEISQGTNTTPSVSDASVNVFALPIYSPWQVLMRSICYIVGEVVCVFGSTVAIIALCKYLPNLKPSTALIMGSLFVTNTIAGLGGCYYSYWNLKLYYFKVSPCLMEIDFLLSLPVQQLPGTVMYFQVSLLCVER